MASPLTLSSAVVRVYLNGRILNTLTSISWSINYGMELKYGIDTPWPQEIADGRASVSVRISAVATHFDGGIMAKNNARALVSDLLQSPYSSLRVENRVNGDTLLYLVNCRCSNESVDAVVKQTVKYSFELLGTYPANGVDLAYSG
jgi:hypothetical protein